jgi:acyl CoA:acetate/3-ketoacid CoA transferase alpha subunit
MIDKIVASCEAAVADVPDGATVMIGGFGIGNGDTGLGCVRRVYTDLAVLEITAAGIVVCERVEGLDFAALRACTGVPLMA